MATKNQLLKTIEFSNKLQKRLKSSELTRTLALFVQNHLILRTPKDRGIAQSNWFASVDKIGLKVNSKLSDGGFESKKTFPKAKTDNAVFYIQNNLPYIKRLEDGHSSQRPNGFINQAIKLAYDDFLRHLKTKELKR